MKFLVRPFLLFFSHHREKNQDMAATKGLGEDVHSYSNFSEILVTHIYPHLYVDFNRYPKDNTQIK